MANTGEIFFTAASTTSEAPHSDEPWVSPSNALTSNDTYASVTATTFDATDQTEILRTYDASSAIAAAIPADSRSIDGIIVRVNAYSDGATGRQIDLIQLLSATGALSGNNLAGPTTVTTNTAAVYTFGSSTEKWGLGAGLTRDLLIDPQFGVGLGFVTANANSEAYVDYVSIDIYYTGPPTTYYGQVATALGNTITTEGEVASKGYVSYASFEIPAEAAITGQTTLTETIGVTTVGRLGAKGQTTATETINRTTSGRVTAKAATAATETVSFTTSGKVTAKGASTMTETVTLVTDGVISQGPEDFFGQSSMALAAAVTAQGVATHFGASSMETTVGVTSNGTSVGAGMGQTSMALSAGITTAGVATHFGSTSLAASTAITTSGAKTTHGASSLAASFAFTTAGQPTHFGIVSLPLAIGITSQSGAATHYGVSSLTTSVSRTTFGFATHTGSVSLALNATIITAINVFGTICSETTICGETTLVSDPPATHYGQSVVGLQNFLTTKGWAAHFGARSAFGLTIGITTQSNPNARRAWVAWSSFETPFAEAPVFGRSSLLLTDSITTTPGPVTHFGRSSVAASVAITTNGESETAKFGASSMALSAGIVTNGRRTRFGRTTFTANTQIVTSGANPAASKGLVSWASFETPQATIIFGRSTSSFNVSTTTIGSPVNVNGVVSTQLTFLSNVNGVGTEDVRIAAAGLVFLFGDAEPSGRVAFNITAATTTTGGPVTVFGRSSSQFDFSVATRGAGSFQETHVAAAGLVYLFGDAPPVGTVYGSSRMDLVAGRTTTGTVHTTGRSSFSITDGVTTIGRVGTYGRVVLPLGLSTFVFGGMPPPIFGLVKTNLAAGITTNGLRTGIGRISLPLSLTLVSEGTWTHLPKYGQSSLQITDTIQTAAWAAHFDRVSLTIRIGRPPPPVRPDYEGPETTLTWADLLRESVDPGEPEVVVGSNRWIKGR